MAHFYSGDHSRHGGKRQPLLFRWKLAARRYLFVGFLGRLPGLILYAVGSLPIEFLNSLRLGFPGEMLEFIGGPLRQILALFFLLVVAHILSLSPLRRRGPLVNKTKQHIWSPGEQKHRL